MDDMNLIRPALLTETVDLSLLRDEILPEIFAATVSRSPQAPAAQFADQRLSYGELDDRANRLALALGARGIGRGSFVGLWMSRSLDLHVALLGILKAGAAYLPFDADAPADRVADCLADCNAAAIILDAATAAKPGELPAARLEFAGLLAEGVPGPAPDLRAEGASPADPAYVIYTSGSTGKPKGVVISHHNICHFLRSANQVYGLTAEDVVFQGASVAFDLSLEEIFVPYLVGAKLWIASRQVLQDTENLAEVLTQGGVTVLDTVPTLLSMLPGDVASLRVIILGGEACPPSVAARWCRPGRRIFNSYGPTEATVVASVAEVRPDEPVTIGKPIPNYSCYVVDEQMALVAPGVEGELLIGGPGVAAGYLNRPELTAQKFIANPFDGSGLDPVLYRSGDAVALDGAGNMVFHGRIDDQVKIRGYRVELGEIEARLSRQPGIAAAAVVLRHDGGTERLVAFLVAEAGAEVPERRVLRDALNSQLPCYMVPSHYEPLAELPRLISGKVDRKALAQLPLTAIEADPQEEPQTPAEAALLAAAQRVFPGQTIPFDADFFTELGGHSLIAARFVSVLRETLTFASLTLQDVYALRSLRRMGELLEQRSAESGPAQQRDLSFETPPLLRRFLCGVAQLAVLPFILALTTAPWLGVFVAYQLFSGEEHNFVSEVGALLVAYAGLNICTIFFGIAGKWLAIGKVKPGRYPLWGVYYFRWWLSRRFLSLLHLKWFEGTPLIRALLRALGAKVGEDAVISDLDPSAIDLVTIGKHASLGGKLLLANAQVVGNELIIGRIEIGDDVSIASSVVIGPNVTIGEGAELADLTSIDAGTVVGAWERWEGSPGRRVGSLDPAALPAAAETTRMRKLAHTLIYLLMLIILPPITLIPIIPAFYLFDNLSDVIDQVLGLDYLTVLPMLAWPAAMVLIPVTVLMIALVRWIVLPQVVTKGTYSIHSWFALRKWIVALATELTLETLAALYATVYMCSWYRLMGAKIGKDAEISASPGGRYDLTEIGEKCFIADEVVLGDENVRRGWMTLEPIRTGDRVFVGNSAVLPPGTNIPDGCLIGIKSVPPDPARVTMAPGDIWFGSPPINLPGRQRFDNIPAEWTFEPSKWRRRGRAIFEAFRVSLPTMLSITFGTLAVEILAPSILAHDYELLVPLFIAASTGIALSMTAVAILIKWGLMGTYRPTMRPMWSWWALCTEAVGVTYFSMAATLLLDHLCGTPMLPWVLRLFGCRFGQGVFLNTNDITEFDCIEVGDFCVINVEAALQTHLYEDRVMKVGRVTLGTGVTLGAGSTVLYDTHVGDFAQIGQLTVIMKGESIPGHSQWQGAPAQPSPVRAEPPRQATADQPHPWLPGLKASL
jgi:non-ribosomal peptide synthetase-like protein